MARTTFCDWCGELMEVPANEEPLHLTLSGHGGMATGRRVFFTSLPFNYHTEMHHDGTVDPECCLGQLQTFLAERASWAHDPEQGSSEWRLVPRSGRIETYRESKHRKRGEEVEAREARNRRWSEKTKDERITMIKAELASGDLTISEIVAKLEANHDLNTYDGHVRPLMNYLYAEGDVEREGEQYRKGPSLRYRYSLAGGEG